MIHAPIRRLSTVLLLFIFIGVSRQAAFADDSPQEAAVRQTLASLGQAYNQHDAAAFAAAWTDGGVYADPSDGNELRGREQIKSWYSAQFKLQPDTKLTAKITEIEFEGDAHAFVRGTAEVTAAAGEPNRTSFLAELVKVNDRWSVASVEESDPDPLVDLAWLVGDWKDDDAGTSIESSCTWDAGGRMLLRKFSIVDDSGEKRSGTQYIVWDAARGELRSWVFGSQGIVGEGRWEQFDDRWAIHWTATLADGRPASATQVIKPVDEDSFQVQWTDIDVDGELRPSTDLITVRRVIDANEKSEEAHHE